MTSTIEQVRLAQWSRWLREEIFVDHDGDGRPVTTILVDDALLSRAMLRGGVRASGLEARAAFLAAFPSREIMSGWFSGRSGPGVGLMAFLVLCCFAASEAAGIDLNAYRKRLETMMGWTGTVDQCQGLPRLWDRLVQELKRAPASERLRPLELPDPRYRSQIGHAIELTFPSAQDTRRLRTELDHADDLDPRDPERVIGWLARRRQVFSPSFMATLRDFRVSWRNGDRSLADHRFWTGWTLVIDAWVPPPDGPGLRVRYDEWGVHQLFSDADEAAQLAALGKIARSDLRRLITNGAPILLREADWGCWCFAGGSPSAAREAGAALIRDKSISPMLLAQFDRASVLGAEGWSLTTSLHLLPSSVAPSFRAGDQLIAISVSEAPRTDGGWLARPSFPLVLTARGAVDALSISGEVAPEIELRKREAGIWEARPRKALDGDVTVTLKPKGPGRSVIRTLALRATTLVPDLGHPLPSRFAPEEPASPRAWSPTCEGEVTSIFGALVDDSGAPTHPVIEDLIEYFAARPGPLALGAVLPMLESALPSDGPGAWEVLRALMEGGVVTPLRVVGWRGGALLARPPRAILRREPGGCVLILDGLINTVLIARARGLARGLGLDARTLGGVSAWSPPVHVFRADDPVPLAELALRLSIALVWLAPDLSGLTRLTRLDPNVDGAGHSRAIPVRRPEFQSLEERGASLFQCARERDDQPRVWRVDLASGRRFWSHRNLAILDACRATGLAAFSRESGTTRLNVAGAYLPLPAALWTRWACLAGSGPDPDGYRYPMVNAIAGDLTKFMGALLARAPLMAPNPVELRARRGAGLAIARGGTVSTRSVWAWSRERAASGLGE